jgi:hypothetical protein
MMHRSILVVAIPITIVTYPCSFDTFPMISELTVLMKIDAPVHTCRCDSNHHQRFYQCNFDTFPLISEPTVRASGELNLFGEKLILFFIFIIGLWWWDSCVNEPPKT